MIACKLLLILLFFLFLRHKFSHGLNIGVILDIEKDYSRNINDDILALR